MLYNNNGLFDIQGASKALSLQYLSYLDLSIIQFINSNSVNHNPAAKSIHIIYITIIIHITIIIGINVIIGIIVSKYDFVITITNYILVFIWNRVLVIY